MVLYCNFGYIAKINCNALCNHASVVTLHLFEREMIIYGLKNTVPEHNSDPYRRPGFEGSLLLIIIPLTVDSCIQLTSVFIVWMFNIAYSTQQTTA